MAAAKRKRNLSIYILPILFCGLLVVLTLVKDRSKEQPVKAVLQAGEQLTLSAEAIENYLYSAGFTLQNETLLDGEGKEAGALTVETNESGSIAGMTLAFPLPTYIDTGDGDILADLKAAHDAGAQRGEEMFLALFDAIVATDSRVATRRDSALEKLRQTIDTGKATAQAANSWRFGFSLEPGMFEGTVTIRFTLVK